MRILLGVALLLMAAGFLALVPFLEPVSPRSGPGAAILGLLCAIGATACLWRVSHPVTVRAVGAIVFAACVWYVADQARPAVAAFAPGVRGRQADPVLGVLDRRSRPSLINSLLFLNLVGLPAGYAALTGRYPGWGRHASAFGSGRAR